MPFTVHASVLKATLQEGRVTVSCKHEDVVAQRGYHIMKDEGRGGGVSDPNLPFTEMITAQM